MRIAVLDDYQGVARKFGDWSGIEERAEITVFNTPFGDQDELIEELQPFDIVCMMRERTPLRAAAIAALPNLKLIVTTGMRNAAIDIAAAAARGIPVCGTASPGHATAELAFGLVIALARRLLTENQSMADGAWQIGVGRDLKGATLGIIGLGRLGAQMAGYAKAFDMNVIAWSANLTRERCEEVGVTFAREMEDVLRHADFLTIHTRLSPRTRALIGAAELALMKPDACLINTSRGPVVDQMALIAALSAGQIAGAALDVYDEEPLPAGHPLHGAPNLLLTPHLGYVTRETYQVFYREMVENIEAFLAGAPVRLIPA